MKHGVGAEGLGFPCSVSQFGYSLQSFGSCMCWIEMTSGSVGPSTQTMPHTCTYTHTYTPLYALTISDSRSMEVDGTPLLLEGQPLCLDDAIHLLPPCRLRHSSGLGGFHHTSRPTPRPSGPRRSRPGPFSPCGGPGRKSTMRFAWPARRSLVRVRKRRS